MSESPPTAQPGPSARAAARARLWRHGRLAEEDFPLGQLDVHLAEPDSLAWVDLVAPDPQMLAQLAEELGMTPQAVDATIAHRERPKAGCDSLVRPRCDGLIWPRVRLAGVLTV